MTEKEKMLSGRLFMGKDPELIEIRSRCRRILQKFNGSSPDNFSLQMQLLAELFGRPTTSIVLHPFHCEHGIYIEMGDHCIVNTDCCILDCAPVKIGNKCLFGPGTRISTVTHPMHSQDRHKHLLYAKPVTIGDNVWFGAGVVVNPGVSIGKDSIIGAGSVVTKDIPEGVIAYGAPCRVVRPITDADRMDLPVLAGRDFRRS